MQIWDYDIDASWKPKTDDEWEWFLVRKINYDDYIGLTKTDVKRFFPRIKHLLDPGKRAMLEYFLPMKLTSAQEKAIAQLAAEKKTLQPRTKLRGVYIDSLEDVAANKTMALFDRNEPKDVFDLYFLLTKKGFTAEKLVGLTQQKFGVSFAQGLFWSETFKSFPLLYSLKPLLEGQTDKEAETLLKTIEGYFKQHAADFLKKQLR